VLARALEAAQHVVELPAEQRLAVRRQARIRRRAPGHGVDGMGSTLASGTACASSTGRGSGRIRAANRL
jgi:hypothetical protein